MTSPRPPSSGRLPGAEPLYTDVLLDHARQPRHSERLALPTLSARADNPLCGDLVELELCVVDGRVTEVTDTRWDRIVTLYEMRMRLAPSRVVALNRAIAVGEAEGPQRGLDELRALEEAHRLDDYRFYAAATGEMLLRAGRAAEARGAFERAKAKARTPDEERWFGIRIAACELSKRA
jgi:hypothetical protein